MENMNQILTLKNQLSTFIDLVYGNQDEAIRDSYKRFKITFSKKEMKQNEKYQERELVIFNLCRQEVEIINSLIMMLSSHVYFCMTGDFCRKKEFMELYSMLLRKALDYGYLDYNELKESNDYINNKKVKEALESYWPSSNKEDTTIFLEVYDSYSIKDTLSNSGFKYNSIQNCWEKEIVRKETENVKKQLLLVNPQLRFKVRTKNKMIVSIDAMICISGNTFESRGILKQEKYIYKDKKWLKKIKANGYSYERERILSLLPKGQGIKVSVIL